MFHHQSLYFVSEKIWIKLISRYYNNPLTGHFDIKKTCKLLAHKFYWQTFHHDIKAYVKCCDVCLASNAIWHKPYSNLQSLPVPTHRWKDFSINFVTRFRISTNWKGESYNSIWVIIDSLTKIVHYEPIEITIDTPGLAKIIINVVLQEYSLFNLM